MCGKDDCLAFRRDDQLFDLRHLRNHLFDFGA